MFFSVTIAKIPRSLPGDFWLYIFIFLGQFPRLFELFIHQVILFDGFVDGICHVFHSRIHILFSVEHALNLGFHGSSCLREYT